VRVESNRHSRRKWFDDSFIAKVYAAPRWKALACHSVKSLCPGREPLAEAEFAREETLGELKVHVAGLKSDLEARRGAAASDASGSFNN
jgi:hypothetical protein